MRHPHGSHLDKGFARTRFWVSGILVAGLVASVTPAQGEAEKATNQDRKTRTSSFEGLEEAGAAPKKRAGEVANATKAAAKTAEIVILRTSGEVALREVPSQTSPTVGEPLDAGALLVRLGATEYGHVPVGLLRGFRGYVHSKFFRDLGNGWGQTAGTNVSFRARPRSGEPPLWLMPKNATMLAILGRDGDWYRVLSAPSVRAWIAESAVEDATKLPAAAFDLDDGRTVVAAFAGRPSMQKQLASSFAAIGASWQKQQKELAEAAARREASTQLETEVVELTKDYDAMRGRKDLETKDFDAMSKRVDLLQKLATENGLDGTATTARLEVLAANLERQKILNEAKKIVAAPVPVVDSEENKEPTEAEVVAERKAKSREARRSWDRVGWIEYRPGTRDYRPFRLMKGGQTIAYLECSSGRYDLSDFTGREVGLVGELERPENADLRVLDIERIVILSSSTR